MKESKSPRGVVLVVDDERSIRDICRRTLEKVGYRVFTAETGEEAWALIQKDTFDFVLTDITMPGRMQGPALMARIRQECPTIDVVIMTAFPSLDTAIPTLKEGAYDYLIKPFDQSLLLSAVERCFEKRQLATDLDRERAWRQELQAAYGELKKLEKLKEAFLARLSHELRTPFVAVFHSLGTLEEQVQTVKGREAVGTLRSMIDHLWSLIHNMLLLADLQEKSYALRREPVAMAPLIESLVAQNESGIESKRLTVQVSGEALQETFSCDASLLRTALSHLIQNAVRFNVQGGTVQVRVYRHQDALHVEVADSGIGIPQRELSNTFDSFYQIAEYLTREVGGLGVGLALVRRIAEAHGGCVFVSSQEGKGTTFKLILPNRRADEECMNTPRTMGA